MQSSECSDSTSTTAPWSSPVEDGEHTETDSGVEDCPLKPVKRRQRRQRERLRTLHSFNSYVTCGSIVAVMASASMLTRQMENIARADGASQQDVDGIGGLGFTMSAVIANLKNFFVYYLSTVVARISEGATWLADAIGPPPQRIMAGSSSEGNELLMFVAINLFFLCTLASMACFIGTFWASPEGVDATEQEAMRKMELAARSRLTSDSALAPGTTQGLPMVPGIFRMFSVFGVSLAAGMGLGWRSAFQSALLCGC